MSYLTLIIGIANGSMLGKAFGKQALYKPSGHITCRSGNHYRLCRLLSSCSSLFDSLRLW